MYMYGYTCFSLYSVHFDQPNASVHPTSDDTGEPTLLSLIVTQRLSLARSRHRDTQTTNFGHLHILTSSWPHLRRLIRAVRPSVSQSVSFGRFSQHALCAYFHSPPPLPPLSFPRRPPTGKNVRPLCLSRAASFVFRRHRNCLIQIVRRLDFDC